MARGRVVAFRAARVHVWETDPAPGAVVARPLPDAGRFPLAFRLDHRKPRDTLCAPHTPGFRYWVAAEALRRTADLWAPCVPGGVWRVGKVLPVRLNSGEAFNALYDRSDIRFYHGPAPPGPASRSFAPHGTIYAGESADIVCHEMGHAVLDTLKPALFHAAGHEFPAFHESFGDITAILAALQLPELRASVLAETGGDLTRNSRLSRLGEQMGAAIRARAPEAVDADCLRNAANAFTYRNPALLPTSTPASQLAAEPHSLSRVFTGAFLDALAATLRLMAARPAAPDQAELLAASLLLRDLLAEAVGASAVVAGYYAEVAACLVRAAAARQSELATALTRVFQARAIPQAAPSAGGLAPVRLARPVPVLADLIVEAPAADDAAADFVARLFAQGRVDLASTRLRLRAGGLRTHRLQADAGGPALRRCHFDCGLLHL